MLQGKLDQANERLEKLETELSSKDGKDICEELQKRIESLQEQLSKKEEECLTVQKELCAANSARSSLESGKTKAKSEIHGLLRRVQESERWMKSVRNTLERLGIDTSKEPFSETWNRLETLLRATTRTSSRPASSSQRNSIATPCGLNTPRGNPIASTPRKNCMSPSQVVQTTEFIYRTRSIKSGAYSSPERQGSVRPADVDCMVESIPESQPMTNIVPFSDIHKQLSPEHACSPEGLGELTEALMMHSTPKNGLSCPDRDSTGTEPMTQEAVDCTDIKQTGIKRKAVAFQSQDANTTGQKVPTPELSNDGTFEKHATQEVLGEKVTRQTRRTYSRTRQYDSVREPRNNALNASPSVSKTTGGRSIAESPCSHKNKRAKMSTASSSKPQRQTSDTSEYFELKASPPSLASGSRHSSANGNFPSQKRTTRGQRRGGRKSRGRQNSPGDVARQ